MKENSFRYMRAHVKTVLIERSYYFCRFIGLERLNTLLCVRRPVFASETKQLREKTHVQQYIGSGQLLKWQQSFMLIKQKNRESLTALD